MPRAPVRLSGSVTRLTMGSVLFSRRKYDHVAALPGSASAGKLAARTIVVSVIVMGAVYAASFSVGSLPSSV